MSLANEFWIAFESALGSNTSQLPSGANPHSLRAAEEHFGIAFPALLKQLLLRHDGSNACFLLDRDERCHYLMSLSWMLAVAKRKLAAAHASISHRAIGHVSACYWNSKWVPIATNTDGDYLLMDFSPPESGMPGQLIYWDHEGANSWISTRIDDWINSMVDGIASSSCKAVFDQYA